jgi:dTDP-4-amino-4,6-dideoxygalactose transaminase
MRPLSSRAPGKPLSVPFVDLQPMNSAVREQVLLRMGEMIDRGDFVNGAAVAEFEERFREYCERRQCVGVSSGLDALRLALIASGLEPGAGVVVPASTFAATFEAVIQAGGTPVVVDVTEDDYCLDPIATERMVSEGAATHLLPVHLYGQMADMRALWEVAAKHGLQIVEDACQAHGAERDGIRPGSRSRAAAFSFYPAKNLGAMGDAGALVTDDEELSAHVRALREHGETRKYHHDYQGYTARLDTIQALVLLEKLPLLAEWTERRRAAARFYGEALAELDDLRLPPQPEGSEPVWHLYVVRTSDRERLADFLADRGIRTGRHYPEPVHLAPGYHDLGHAPGDFPVAEALSREGLSLPLYPGISDEQLEWVCEAIHDYFQHEGPVDGAREQTTR